MKENNNKEGIFNEILSDKSLKACWKNAIGTQSADEIFGNLTKDLPKNTALDIKFNNQTKKISVLTLENQKYKFNFTYSFTGAEAEFVLGGVDKSLQNKGVARIAQRNIFKLLAENNVKQINAFANNIGAYSWARMGFLPEKYHLDTVVKEIKKRLDNINYYLCDKFTPEDIEHINFLEKSLSKKSSPKIIWDIVDDKKPFFNYDGLTWGKAMLLPYEYLPQETGIDSNNYNISYSCNFDFSSKDSVNRANNYFYPQGYIPVLNIRPNGENAFDIYDPSKKYLRFILD